MFDHEDIQLLRDNRHLQQLLTHYAELGKQDRKIWQPRLMAMDGLAPAQITKLHGELLAFEWVEQDTGALRASYRVTPSGVRSLKQAIQGSDDEDVVEMVEEEKPKAPRKKRAVKSDESTATEAGEPPTPAAA